MFLAAIGGGRRGSDGSPVVDFSLIKRSKGDVAPCKPANLGDGQGRLWSQRPARHNSFPFLFLSKLLPFPPPPPTPVLALFLSFFSSFFSHFLPSLLPLSYCKPDSVFEVIRAEEKKKKKENTFRLISKWIFLS